jgi:hypothetical protein
MKVRCVGWQWLANAAYGGFDVPLVAAITDLRSRAGAVLRLIRPVWRKRHCQVEEVVKAALSAAAVPFWEPELSSTESVNK